ncbi:MAG: hypothetical protein CM1200mP40_33120 [Gammaproteobacteria bacterium]|nr:MAG: hypothetical protein CM1200mP40_33120 [Gammaproteobacteria bacterium]
MLIEPKINEDGVVNLIITQTLRSVDNSATGINNNPVFNNQEITTSVVVRDGENLVLGGLIQTDSEQLNTGFLCSTEFRQLGIYFRINKTTPKDANSLLYYAQKLLI